MRDPPSPFLRLPAFGAAYLSSVPKTRYEGGRKDHCSCCGRRRETFQESRAPYDSGPRSVDVPRRHVRPRPGLSHRLRYLWHQRRVDPKMTEPWLIPRSIETCKSCCVPTWCRMEGSRSASLGHVHAVVSSGVH